MLINKIDVHMPNLTISLSQSFLEFVDLSLNVPPRQDTDEGKSIRTEMLCAYITHHLTTKEPCYYQDILTRIGYPCGKPSTWSRITNKELQCLLSNIDRKMIAQWKEK